MADFDYKYNSSIFNEQLEASEDYYNIDGTTPTKSEKREVAVQDFALIIFGLFYCDGISLV